MRAGRPLELRVLRALFPLVCWSAWRAVANSLMEQQGCGSAGASPYRYGPRPEQECDWALRLRSGETVDIVALRVRSFAGQVWAVSQRQSLCMHASMQTKDVGCNPALQAEQDPEQQIECQSQQEFHTVLHAVAGSVIRLIGRRVSVQPRSQNLCLCQQTRLQLKQPCRQIHTGVDHCEDNDGVVSVIAHKNVPANTVET